MTICTQKRRRAVNAHRRRLSERHSEVSHHSSSCHVRAHIIVDTIKFSSFFEKSSSTIPASVKRVGNEGCVRRKSPRQVEEERKEKEKSTRTPRAGRCNHNCQKGSVAKHPFDTEFGDHFATSIDALHTFNQLFRG